MKTSARLLLAGLALLALAARSAAADPASVDALVPVYLGAQTALAGDSLDAAKAAGEKLAALARDDQATADLAAAAARLAGAADLKAARADFAAVSTAFTALVESVGTSGAQTLYVAHCPMAFGGKGGDWVQGDRKIQNPYFGSMMLGCGGIRKQIAGN